MMRYLIIFVALITITLADDGPPPIIWQGNEKRPEVVDKKENIQIEKDQGGAFFEDLESGSAAAKIAMVGHRLGWMPRWNFTGSGNVRLPDAALSKDQSVLAIIETVGEERGPWQSRIVCISPDIGKILRIIELSERDIRNIMIVGESAEAVILQLGQKVFKQSNQLLKLNLANGQIIDESTPMNSKPEAIAINSEGTIIALKQEGSPDIWLYDVNELSKPPAKIPTTTDSSALEFTEDGESIMAAGSGKICFYNLVNLGTQTRDPINISTTMKPSLITVAPGNPNEILLAQSGGQVILVRNGSSYDLEDVSGGFAEFVGNSIMLLAAGNSVVRFIDRDNLTEKLKLQLKGDRPPTRGNIIQLYHTNREGLLAIDSHGNIYTRKPSGKKWRKKMLIQTR